MTTPMRREFSQPDARTIRALVELVVEAERRLHDPWDEWEVEVLRAWRDKARDMLEQALRYLPGGQRVDELLAQLGATRALLELRSAEIAELKARLGSIGLRMPPSESRAAAG